MLRTVDKPGRTTVAATVALLTLIWGTTWAAVRFSLDGFPPLTGAAIRFAIGGAILLAVTRLRRVRLGRTPYEGRLWAVQTLLTFVVSYTLVYWAEQWVPSGLTSVLFSTHPLFVALFAWFLIPSERLGRVGLLGLAVGFGGVAVIFSEDLASLAGPEVRTAALIFLVSPVCVAGAEVVVKRWGHDVSALSLTAVPMAASSVVLAGLALAFERGRPIELAPAPVAAVLYLAVAGSAVAFSLFFWLLKHVTVTQLSLIAYAIPVVAVAVGTAFLGEPFTPRMVAGSALVIGGAALVMR